MKGKIKGGALLIAGASDDYRSGIVSYGKTMKIIDLIKDYESGKLTLKELNRIW